MKFELKKDTTAYVFSYNKVRDWITVKAGTLVSIDVDHTSWGEEVIIFDGYPPLITATYYGNTPFKEALQVVK